MRLSVIYEYNVQDLSNNVCELQSLLLQLIVLISAVDGQKVGADIKCHVLEPCHPNEACDNLQNKSYSREKAALDNQKSDKHTLCVELESITDCQPTNLKGYQYAYLQQDKVIRHKWYSNALLLTIQFRKNVVEHLEECERLTSTVGLQFAKRRGGLQAAVNREKKGDGTIPEKSDKEEPFVGLTRAASDS